MPTCPLDREDGSRDRAPAPSGDRLGFVHERRGPGLLASLTTDVSESQTGVEHGWMLQEPAPARERYDSVFGDQIVKVGNAWRMAKGDNRQLPVGETRYTGRLSLGQSLRRLVARAIRR